MLKNDREYVSTKKKIRKLEDALRIADKTTVEMPDFIFDAMVAGIQSQIDDMKAEVQEYEQLAGSNTIAVESLENIGELLIKARISHGYNQKNLAAKVGLSPQQIQKYEADEYQSADLKKIVEIAAALELTMEGIGSLKGKSLKWNIPVSVDSFSVKANEITVEKVQNSSWISTQQEKTTYNFNKVA